jgi:hypothetical protein
MSNRICWRCRELSKGGSLLGRSLGGTAISSISSVEMVSETVSGSVCAGFEREADMVRILVCLN